MSHVISQKQHLEIMRRAKTRAMAPARVILRTGGLTLTSAILGFAEAKQTLPKGFFKNKAGVPMIPTKAAIAVLAHGVAAFSRGTLSAAASVVGDAAACSYGFSAGRAQALVAGDD